jgi:hypothetical protein
MRIGIDVHALLSNFYQNSCPWIYGPHHPPPLLQVKRPRLSGESMMSFNPFFALGGISEKPLITPFITVTEQEYNDTESVQLP